MKPTDINNCCTESASSAARRIQDIGTNHEDRTFPTCSATAHLPCNNFIMFFGLSHTTHRRTQMSRVRKHVIQNITKIRWLFEQIEIIRILVDKNVYIYIYVSIDIVVHIHIDDCLSTQIYLYMWIYDSFLKCLFIHILICWLCFSDMLKCFLKAL